jgi:predicted ABC-type ATPase
MRIVSFYTKNTGYQKEVEKLQHSVKKNGHSIYTEGIESLGSWDLNTKHKPYLILNAMKKYPKEDYFLFLDADAIVNKKIPMEDISGDIAVCHKAIESKKQKGWLLSGTVFIKNNEKMKRIMNEWIKINKKQPKTYDQATLYIVLKNNFEELDIQRLPLRYCKINGSKCGTHQRIKDPIISHNQASRKLKGKINGQK